MLRPDRLSPQAGVAAVAATCVVREGYFSPGVRGATVFGDSRGLRVTVGRAGADGAAGLGAGLAMAQAFFEACD